MLVNALSIERPRADEARPLPIEQHRVALYALLLLADLGLLMASYLGFGWLYYDALPARAATMLLPIVLPLYCVIALYHRVYSIDGISNWPVAARRIAEALAIALGLTLLLTFYAQVGAVFSRLTFTFGSLMALGAMLVLRRFVVDYVQARFGPYAMNILVLRDGGPTMSIAGRFESDCGSVNLAPHPQDLGMIARFAEITRHMDRVVVSTSSEREAAWAHFLRVAGAEAEIVTDRLQHLNALALRRYGDRTLLMVARGPMGLRQRSIKRAFDLVVAAVALIVLAPLLGLIAFLIRREDGGPALFVQQRVGKNNRLFSVYKFRSMTVDRQSRDGRLPVVRHDDRVTRIGALLRRTSVDELPQLVNVLKGDMSLVGPRPHAPASRAGDRLFWEVDAQYWHRHALKPGMTGLAQIRGLRGATLREADLKARLEADLEYLRDWTLLRDIRILASTANVLIHPRAY